jgi:ribosomal protein S18 acetylase RimI-like enzyme
MRPLEKIMESTFRAAGWGDRDRILRLVESAYRGEASRAGWTTEADLLDGQRTDRQELEELLRDPSAVIVLSFVADDLVGCVKVYAKGEGLSHIGMFAIEPRLQSRGLGGALLAEAERVAREQQGAVRTEMTVIEQRHELLGWYARRGYHPTGETQPFPYGNPRFGLPRRDDLRFVVLVKQL